MTRKMLFWIAAVVLLASNFLLDEYLADLYVRLARDLVLFGGLFWGRYWLLKTGSDHCRRKSMLYWRKRRSICGCALTVSTLRFML